MATKLEKQANDLEKAADELWEVAAKARLEIRVDLWNRAAQAKVNAAELRKLEKAGGVKL